MTVEQRRVLKRSIIPAVIAMAATLVFQVLYNRSVGIRAPLINDAVKWIGLIGMLVFSFFPALIIYPYAFFRGAGFAERLWAALAAPLLKSFLIISAFFGIYSVPEVLFMMIHHVVLSPLVFAFFEIGAASLVCHGIKKRRSGDRTIRVFLQPESIFLLLGSGLFVLFFWELGHWYYFWFLDLYIKLFG